MTRLLLALAASFCVLAPAIAQLPQGSANFDGNSMFPAQAPPGAPAATLTGEAPADIKIWSGGVEAGVNGQSGNTDVFNLRTGWNLQRKTVDNLLTSDFVYSLAKQEGIETQNQALFNARDEILFALTDGLDDGRALGTQGQPIRGILDIASGVDVPIHAQQRGPDFVR